MGLDKREIQRRRAALEQRQLAERNEFTKEYMSEGLSGEINWGAPLPLIYPPTFKEPKCKLFNTAKSLELDMNNVLKLLIK